MKKHWKKFIALYVSRLDSFDWSKNWRSWTFFKGFKITLTVTNDEWKGYVSLAYKGRISTYDFKFECGENRTDYWLSTYELFLDNPT